VRQVEFDRRATPARRGHLARRAGDPARAEILEPRGNAPFADPAERLGIRHVQHALEKRIRQLHGAALVATVLVELVRRERGAPEPAFVRRLPDQHERPRTRPLRDAAAQDAVGGRDPHRHDVDERVVVESGVKHRVAAEIRNAQGIPVIGNALDHPTHDVAGVHAAGRIAKAERVEHAHDFGSHADHVAHDATHSRGRALDGQHLARVIVALVRQHKNEVLAGRGQRHDARVLPWAEHHLRRARRQAAQKVARRLVRTVLAPQNAEQHGLRPERRAPEQLDQQGDFFGIQLHAPICEARGNLGRRRGLLPRISGQRANGHAHRSGLPARSNRSSTCLKYVVTSKHAASLAGSSFAVTSGSAASRSRNALCPSLAAIA
jgi:hypothetical protein